jgi:6-phosphogluconolactonase
MQVDRPQEVRWLPIATSQDMARLASAQILGEAASAISARGVFRLVLAGGGTPRATYAALRSADADWSRWEIFFGDERCLPAANPERNSKMAEDVWLDHVPIARERIHQIPGELGAQRAAQSYIEVLRNVGEFDFVVLGIGEEGHTASLFPKHEWGAGDDAPDALAIFDAPKPPPQRVSMSAARLSRARKVIFLVEGNSKLDAVARWRAGENIPAGAIKPASGVDVLISG